jgi:hypothetical protein
MPFTAEPVIKSNRRIIAPVGTLSARAGTPSSQLAFLQGIFTVTQQPHGRQEPG